MNKIDVYSLLNQDRLRSDIKLTPEEYQPFFPTSNLKRSMFIETINDELFIGVCSEGCDDSAFVIFFIRLSDIVSRTITHYYNRAAVPRKDYDTPYSDEQYNKLYQIIEKSFPNLIFPWETTL